MAIKLDWILSSWRQPLRGVEASSSQFYEALEKRVASLRLEGAKVARVDMYEAGAFSAKREYLRVERGPYRFDVCGAPFGDSFFVSWWLTSPPPGLAARIALMVLCIAGWALVAGMLSVPVQRFVFYDISWAQLGVSLSQLGLILGAAVGLVHVFAALSVLVGLHIAVVLHLIRAETAEVIPVFGFVYRRIVSPVTYYRIDTASIFGNAVHSAVLDAIDAVTEGKGIKVLTEEQRKPVMRGLLAA